MKARLQEDVKTVMKARDTKRLAVVRMLMAAIKQKEVDDRIELDDNQILSVIEKMIKQRKDSLSQFEQAGREDLAAQERYEIDVLQVYMPAQLSQDEIVAAIQSAIQQTSASSMKDMGQVMAILKSDLQGRADMAEVSRLVKAQLSE